MARKTNSAASISHATIDDLDVIDRIERRSFSVDRAPRRNLAYALRSAGAIVTLARLGGTPAGYAHLLFREGSDIARLYSLAVDPDARGRGVAQQLLDDAMRKAYARGARRMRLEVRVGNKAARALYHATGFKVLTKKNDYYADGGAALQLERTLVRNGGAI